MFLNYREVFQKRGAAYHEAMQRWPKARGNELQTIIDWAQPRPEDLVLDLPSGGGYLRPLLPEGARLIAIDESENFLHSGPHAGSVEARCAPLDATGLPANHANVAISLAGLHHVPDRVTVFAEVFRVLKPGGVFCVADALAGGAVARFLDGFIDQHNSSGHEGRYLTQASSEELRRAGFEVERAESVDYPWVFPDREALGGYCKLLFGLDLAGDEASVAEGIAEWLPVHERDGQTHLDWSLYFLRARKPAA
ncbi:MAG: class I SAM-dependent methyltransferase [Opitutales bacterium]